MNAQITKFDLDELGKRLKSEPAWHEKKRNSTALFKGESRHIYLVAMHALARISEHKAPCALNIHVLKGRIRVATEFEAAVLGGGGLMTLEAGARYGVEAEKESLFVLEFFPSGSAVAVSRDDDDYFDNWS